jgi:hypothetical protein
LTVQDVDNVWGPLATPLHPKVPANRPPWKDNAYLAFWAPDARLIGVAHVSTSPNAEGRRARLSLSVEGRVVEIIEDLDPVTFTSASLSFGFTEMISIDSPRISGTIFSTPLFDTADYGRRSLIPPLVEGEPVQHFQQAAEVNGTLTVDGRPVAFAGRGLRDRTWGYREESTNLDEYIAILLVSDDWALTAMRFRGTNGVDLSEGYALGTGADEQPRVMSINVTRDAAGLFAGATVTTAAGTATSLTRIDSLGGFWVPMGWTKRGPAMSAYDEFVRVRTAEGDIAVGVIEHGILRRLY